MAITQQPRCAPTQPGPEYPTVVLSEVPPVAPVSPLSFFPTVSGYEIVRQLDQGGMSNIYLAKQKGLERLVVLKMIRPQDSLDDQLRKRFVLEASSIASLQHPNVVQIHEIGEADGMPYLCLEYWKIVPGGNLERKLRERLPSPRVAAEIVRQLAEAIQAAHDRQIIHRDLKPANVLCEILESSAFEEPRIKVKLTDFGLARILCESSDQTKQGYAIGTPSFMSPEQASGRPEAIGKSTDVYGLGAILYELLTGQPPFEGSTASETIRQVREETPVPPSLRNQAVPRDLERICLQCLEKEPDNRYAAAEDLADDLDRFLLGRSVAAHPVGSLRKWWRRCRRHPFLTLALLIAMIMAILTGLSLLLLNQARQKLKTQSIELERAKVTVPVSPDSPQVVPELPPEVRNVVDRIRRDPTAALQLPDLTDDWLARLPKRFPEDFAVRLAVGEAHLLRQQVNESLNSFEEARRIAAEQTRRPEEGTEAWMRLSAAHERIGDVHLLQKDVKTASGDYDRAIALREMLFQDDPQNLRWVLQLASICEKQADVYMREKDWPNALAYQRRRLALLIGQSEHSPALAEPIRATNDKVIELNGKLGK